MSIATDAVFVQGIWLAFFPAVIIGMCLASLIFLWIERRVITGGIWFAFVFRDLLWIAVAVRRILILDQSDVFIVIQEFFIVCLFAYATLKTYQEKRKRIPFKQYAESEENRLESIRNKSERWNLWVASAIHKLNE